MKTSKRLNKQERKQSKTFRQQRKDKHSLWDVLQGELATVSSKSL